jgi:ubiquinone biosynthesis protein
VVEDQGRRTRILAATDRSVSADKAVRWAANLADAQQAELILLQVVAPAARPDDGEDGRDDAARSLAMLAVDLAGERGRARVAVDDDPVRAILQTIDQENVDTVVVGNVGMAGRKQFLLGNVPNRVSHNARCTVVIVNTADAAAGTSYTSLSGDEETLSEGRLLGRAMYIGRTLVKAGLQELRRRPTGDDEEAMRDRARRFRAALEELGPTFAKLGQILSTRPDLIPPSFVDELSHLQERVKPLSEEEVVAAIEGELGVPWEDVFESIEAMPLAAGTIAQVHRATLESGDRVVVKIQRPTAAQDILLDLGLLEMFARKTAERPAFRAVFDMPAIIDHLSSSLRRELDFRGEAANIHRMRHVLEPYPRLAVPAVFADYSTRRLLVMEEVEGVPVRQAPAGPARTEAARQLLESYYSQILSEGFFHADPHSGNLKWWKDQIYFLDFGMVGEVEPQVRELMLLLLLAVWQEDAPFLSEVVLMMAGDERDLSEVDLESFQQELGELIGHYRSLPLQDIQLGPMLQQVTEISVRHNVRLPAALALTGKAIAQMQLAAAELDPTLDALSVAGSFILRNTMRQLAGGLSPQKLFYETRRAGVRISRMIEAVEGLVGARPGSRLQVNFRGTERLEETLSQVSRRLSLAVGFGAAVVGTAMTINSDRAGRWVPALLGGVSSALGVGLIADLMRRRN